jgi:hypothetical protein
MLGVELVKCLNTKVIGFSLILPLVKVHNFRLYFRSYGLVSVTVAILTMPWTVID